MSATNEVTKAIVKWLNLNGYVAWRNNNGAVYSTVKKTFIKNPLHKLGVADIIGYEKRTATFIAVEVKTGKDTLSNEQKYFLGQLFENNGKAIFVHSFDDFLKQMYANS